jgi:hypothetical protein
MMRRYKENEVNREIFFEEEKAQRIETQNKENAERRRKNLEDAGAADTTDISKAIEDNVHPTEGGAPRDL